MNGPLGVALARLAHRLEHRLGELRARGRTRRTDPIGGLAIEPGDAEGILAELSAGATRPSVARGHSELLSAGVDAFDRAAAAFGLDGFERDILLLALAPEVDARFCRLFGFLNDSVVAFRPTVGLAMSVLAPDATERCLSALLPDARLVRHGLVAIEGDAPLAGQSMRIPIDLWPRLVGLDVRERAVPGPQLAELVLSTAMAAQVAAASRALGDRSPAVLIAVHGDHGRDTLADAIASEVGTRVVLSPSVMKDGAARARSVREALWHRATLVVERGCSSEDLVRLCRDVDLPIVAAIEGTELPYLLREGGRRVLEVGVARLDDEARRRLWERGCAGIEDLDSESIAMRYHFDPGRIAAAMALASMRAASRGEALSGADVIAACRTVGEVGVGAGRLIHKLDTPFSGSELVVPVATRCELDLFESAARHGHRLFGHGNGHRIRGSTGFVALFAGPSGTGKTMAAQIIARRLGLDLLRVDLSQVVNKYIGETEKHLDQVFRECEAGGAILFFDEADALFGKRTEVKDAHDRYSNIETAFLLQRLEQHAGVAILATNLKQNLDAAFMRRLHFVVEFPMPGPAERRLIWEIHLDPDARDPELDLDLLSRFELSGGDIRNAVITGTLLGEGGTVMMKHLCIAVSRELRKAGRLSQPADFGPWRATVLAYLRDGVVSER